MATKTEADVQRAKKSDAQRARRAAAKDKVVPAADVEKAPAAVAQVTDIAEQREAKEAKSESLTGTTPKLATMKVGTKLHRLYRGKRYDAEVVAGEGGAHLLRVEGFKPDAASLSSGASLISKHAERGALVWRTEDGIILLPGGPPKYESMAATPGPKKPASKKASTKAGAGSPTRKATGPRLKNGNGKSGTGSVKRSWQCGGCKTKHASQAEATACALTHDPK